MFLSMGVRRRENNVLVVTPVNIRSYGRADLCQAIGGFCRRYFLSGVAIESARLVAAGEALTIRTWSRTNGVRVH